MKMRLYSVVAVLAASLALSACQTPPPAAAAPEVSFTHLEPFRLDVARVEVYSEYRPRAGDGHVETEMPLSPMQAAQIWADQRFVASGAGDLALRFVIKNASVLREDLETDRELRDYFRREQAERYTADLTVEAQIIDAAHMPLASVTTQATRSRTVSEDASIQEREDALYLMTANLVNDLNAEMEKLIPQYFAQWLR